MREQKLKPENGGSVEYLTKAESEGLIGHLSERTYLHVKDICDYVKRAFKKKYTVSGMTKWLHAHQFSYKKPHGVPAKANQEDQNKFIQFYEELKEKAGQKEPIYFIDSVHPQHQTQMVYGWILKGQRKNIPTTARQYHLNFIAGICLEGHRIVYRQAKQVNATRVRSFI